MEFKGPLSFGGFESEEGIACVREVAIRKLNDIPTASISIQYFFSEEACKKSEGVMGVENLVAPLTEDEFFKLETMLTEIIELDSKTKKVKVKRVAESIVTPVQGPGDDGSVEEPVQVPGDEESVDAPVQGPGDGESVEVVE